jgi:hypothetical protein
MHDNIYNDGFEVRFFSEKEIPDLIAKESFNILRMLERYEEPITFYLLLPIRPKKSTYVNTESNFERFNQLRLCYYL